MKKMKFEILNTDPRELEELNKKHFRVVVFGSARIKKGDQVFKDVYELGKGVGMLRADVVTGGGPGLMEAANQGHRDGSGGNGSASIGVGIKLPYEASLNKHLDVQEEHELFSSRLDTFMRLSNVVVVTPGGVGTLLELAYTWQLIQVGHICKIPILMMGDMWKDLTKWAKKYLVGQKLACVEDLDILRPVKDVEEALTIIEKTKNLFEEGAYDACLNWEKYKRF